MLPPPPRSTLFPYTTLFRSFPVRKYSPQPRSTGFRWRMSTRTSLTPFHRRSVSSFTRCRTRFMLRVEGQRRSEEHTSELQSLRHLVCRLLLEKKNYNTSVTH